MLLFNGSCLCPTGEWLVSELCTSIHGCIGLIEQNGAKQCIFCDYSLLLTLVNGSCECTQYYEMVNQTCV